MTRRGSMKILRIVCLVCGFLSLTSVGRAEEAFKLKVAMNYEGHYLEPLDRTFRVQGTYPTSFQVIVVNISSSPASQTFYEDASSQGYSSISFEITDENGNSNVIRKKRDPRASETVSSTYMRQGEKRVFDINLDEDTWENAFKLQKQGSRKFRVRAIYDNNGREIYSEYYALEVIDPSGAQGTQESNKKDAAGVAPVLISK